MKQPAIHYEKTNAIWQLSNTLKMHIPYYSREIVFCCIGTDRSTGDALGPFIGSTLQTAPHFHLPVYGTIEKPLHALNLATELQTIYERYDNPFIVAIDACVGTSEQIGHIFIEQGPIHPGQAFQKDLPPVGQVSIKGVVNMYDPSYSHFQTTRLYVIQQMSRVITEAIMHSVSQAPSKLIHDRYDDAHYYNTWQ